VELSGEAMDRARAREHHLVARNRNSSAADAQFEGVLHRTHQSVTQLRARLDAIERALDEGVTRMAPRANTPAAKRALQQFLLHKHKEVLAVLDDAKQSAGELATHMTGVGGQYAQPADSPAPSPSTAPSAGGDIGDTPGPHGGVQLVDHTTFKNDVPPMLPPDPSPPGPPPPGPPPDQPKLQGPIPKPFQDFTDYTVNGQPVPKPPAPQVTEEQLRQAIKNQTFEFREFVAWFNKTYGGNVSPGDLAARVASFQGSTIGTLASIAGWPEAIPGTVAGLLGMFASGWSLFSADPGTARIPDLGPP